MLTVIILKSFAIYVDCSTLKEREKNNNEISSDWKTNGKKFISVCCTFLCVPFAI